MPANRSETYSSFTSACASNPGARARKLLGKTRVSINVRSSWWFGGVSRVAVGAGFSLCMLKHQTHPIPLHWWAVGHIRAPVFWMQGCQKLVPTQ